IPAWALTHLGGKRSRIFLLVATALSASLVTFAAFLVAIVRMTPALDRMDRWLLRVKSRVPPPRPAPPANLRPLAPLTGLLPRAGWRGVDIWHLAVSRVRPKPAGVVRMKGPGELMYSVSVAVISFAQIGLSVLYALWVLFGSSHADLRLYCARSTRMVN